MQTLLQDLRFGFRILRRSPGFSILAVLCLTLGIGTNAAVLSWIEGILIRPYPLVPHQDRMDPLAFGTAFAVITIASLAACFLPAWRATRIDPVRALREQ